VSQEPTDFNPYQPAAGPGQLQGVDQSYLAKTVLSIARWQTFFAVLMSIGMVGTLGIMSLSMFAGGGDVGAALGGMACVGGATLLMYGLPALMLWRASNAARDYARQPNSPQLAEFASTQLSFWRTVGIIVTVVLALYALMFIGMMAFLPMIN
jgi:hypothetical protein